MMIQAAFQRVCITPPVGTPLGGYVARRGVSCGIHDDLYATALVLQKGKSILALITADLIGVPQDVVRKVRTTVRNSTGIEPDAILIAATHTHSGPDLLFGDQGLASEAYVNTLSDMLAGCVYAAWRSLQPAEVGVEQGWIEDIGKNRRSSVGTPVDPQVGVLRVDHEGTPQGALINYTCHPVVLGPDNLLITADYPGYMVRVVEKVFGGSFKTMFTNGAAGDINTGHSAELSALGEPIPGRTFERAKKLGTMLAGEVLKVLEKIEPSSDILIAIKTKKVPLPLKSLPSLKAAEAAVKEKEKALNELVQKGATKELLTKARIEKLYADILLQQVRTRNKNPRSIELVELQAMRIGDCALLAFPGELFVEIGLKIKANSPFKHTYIVGYANGYIGYVPTKQAFEEGGYEAVATQFAPEASDIMIEESIALLNSLA